MTPAQMAEIDAAAFVTQRPWTEDEFHDLLTAPHVFAVHPTDRCFALGRVIAGEAELLTIATHPEAQRQGLALACLNDFLKTCHDAGATRVFLEVDSLNKAAIALYHAVGFAESGRRKGYYRHPDGSRSDALIMVLNSAT